jgi:hypothetical protein
MIAQRLCARARQRRAQPIAIIAQRADDRMLCGEVELLLFGGLSGQQLANRPQLKHTSRQSDFAGFFQGVGMVAAGQS